MGRPKQSWVGRAGSSYPAGSGVKGRSLCDMELSGISMDICGYSSEQALDVNLHTDR